MGDYDEKNSIMSDDSHFYNIDLFLRHDDNSENDLLMKSCHTSDNLEE